MNSPFWLSDTLSFRFKINVEVVLSSISFLRKKGIGQFTPMLRVELKE